MMKIHIPKKLINKKGAFAATSLVVIAFLVLPGLIFRKHALADSQGPNFASASGDCVDTAGVGTVTWTTAGNAFSNNSTYASASVDGTTTHYIKCTNYGFSIPTGATIDGIVVSVERKSSSTGNGGSKDAAMRIVKGGTIGTTDKATATTYTTSDVSEDHGGTTDKWGDTWTVSDINASNFGAAFAATKANAAGQAHTVTVDVITITVYYTPAAPPSNPLLFALKGYIWENDDEDYAGGDANDGNSQLAAGNTAITVPKGSQVNLRMQVNLSGGDTSGQQFGAFYDHNDGIWSKIGNNFPPKTSSGSGCNDSVFTCSAIDTSNDIGKYSSAVVDSNGIPWVSFYDTTNGDLRVARYVGSDGSGCATSAWDCTTVDSTNDVGSGSSIAFDSSGNPWISYFDATNNNVRTAHYVGSGGSGCADFSWDCSNVTTAGSITSGATSITIDSTGKPWIAFRFSFSLDSDWRVIAAHYVGLNGTGCPSPNAQWNCTNIAAVNFTGENNPSIAIDNSGNPWISFFQGSVQNDLIVAHYVGSGGSCAVGNWECTSVDTSGSVGQYSSIAMDASGSPWVSYYDVTNGDLRIARYVTSGGSGCADAAWTCTTVDSSNDVGQYSSIAMDASGSPWVSYYDVTNGDLRVARYLGSGGSGCASSAWTCTAVETSNDVGLYTSIAFDNYGRAVISYYDVSNSGLRLAKLDDRAGELLVGPASGGLNGDSLSESHVDMTGVSDASNRDDADCIGGGTWTNGMLALSENVAQALTDAHCTEITITVDTSQAVVGRTYRIILATNDNWRKDKGLWRGFNSYDQYATITISDSVMRAGKDNSPKFPNCTDTNWGCDTIETTGDTGRDTSMAFDSAGNPWIAHYDQGSADLRVAQYVGSGGTGCASSAWKCTAVDTSGSVGSNPSIGFSASGVPWIAYFRSSGSALMVAQYVGNGGTGCASSAWTCTALDTNTDISVGQYAAIAFDAEGNPWISYQTFRIADSDLRVAHYVGSGGTGCDASSWQCVTAYNADGTGANTSIAFDSYGNPWISFYTATTNEVMVTHMVEGTSDWHTTALLTVNNTYNTSIAFDSAGNPWVSFYDSSNTDMYVARFVGSGGSGCSTSAWACTAVDISGDMGSGSSIAVDASGNPWLSYSDASNNRLRVARYVGAGGSGCNDSSWTCSTISNANAQYTSIAFDASGAPWVSYTSYNGTDLDLKIAKLHRTSSAFSFSNSYKIKARNASAAFVRHRLTPGASPNASDGSCGTAITDYMGVCAWFQNNGQYDSVVAQANESPTLNMAMKFSDNSKLPTIQWFGRSSYAPNTAGTAGDIVLQVYRYGSTNAWETVASDTSSSDCSAPSAGNCGLSGMPSGTPSDYFYNDGAGGYWVYCRLYQEPNTGGTITFKTDEFNAVRTESRLRHGQFFQDGITRPLNWR